MKTSIFNEKEYLFNPKIINVFEEIGKHSLIISQQEKQIYSNALSHYDEFIEEVAKLIHNLGYSSSLECSIMISYLIHNGFLSDECFIKNKSPNPKKEISHRLGTSIIKGEGCCRNYVSMLKDIFNNLNLPIDTYYCYDGNVIKGIDNRANHAINLIHYKDNIYGIDIFNYNNLYKFLNGLFLIRLSKSNKKLLYKPYYELITGENDEKGIRERIKIFNEYSKKETINPNEYIHRIKLPTQRKMDNSYIELNNFHKRTKTLKKQIIIDTNSNQK